MQATRRSFLKGALALTTIAASGIPALAEIPRIYGNGVHDDAPGLQALFDGLPVEIENERIVAVEGRVENGTFALSRTVHVRSDRIEVVGCEFRPTHTREFANTDIQPEFSIGGPNVVIFLHKTEGRFTNVHFHDCGIAGNYHTPDMSFGVE